METKKITNREIKDYNIDENCLLYPDDLRKSCDFEIKNMGEYWTIFSSKKRKLKEMTSEEKRDYNQNWRDNNRDKMKQYYLNQKEKAHEKGETLYNAEYYAKNVEEIKQRQYKSNDKHKEKRKAYHKEYYAKNKEKLLAYMKEYNEQKKIEKGL